MKIFCLHNNTGSRFYRIVSQLREMQKKGHEVMFEQHDTPTIKERIDWSDLVIFQMISSPEWIDYAKKQGKKVIWECDDLIHRVPKTHYSYKDTKGLKGFKMFWKHIRMFRKCDGFITTCKNLDKVYGIWAKDSIVFPNYLDLEHWLKEYKLNTTDKIRMLWAGSTSHTGDLNKFKPVLNRILKKYPQVQFIYVGMGGVKSTDLQSKFIYGDDFFKGLPNNRESMLPVPSRVWPYILSTMQADLAIAPLEKNYFNAAKSQCKFLEYSVNKIPAVYSAWHYTDVKHGKTGFLATTEKEWEHWISALIENKLLRKEMGNDAYNEVIKKHDIRIHIDKWINFIDKVMGNESKKFKNSNKVKSWNTVNNSVG